MSRPTTAMFFDPSFTGTGWVAVDLLTELPIGAGVISTRPPPPAERRHLTQAAMDGRRGVHIRQRVTLLLEHYQPVVVGQEGNAGSQSAKAAAALARAQQAVLDAIDGYLGGGEPIWVTVQAAKKAACGKLNATKEEVEAAMRQRWPADWDALLNTPDPSGIGTRPRSEWENAFDAASVAAAAWPHLRLRCAAMRDLDGVRRVFGAAVLALVLSPPGLGCGGGGATPPPGRLHFPTAVTMSPVDPELGASRFLFVAHSNFDLRYIHGSAETRHPSGAGSTRTRASTGSPGTAAGSRTCRPGRASEMVKREKLGHRLKRVRIARDLSLRETANKVGVSPTYLSRVENCLDPSPPTEKTLRALADVLEDNLDELMHLAGRVPEDVEKLIKADPDMPVMLRRAREQNVTGAEFLEWLETKKKGGK